MGGIVMSEAAAPREGSSPIQIQDLHKSMGAKKVLDGITFQAHQGETLAILGPSGGGKTVLLKHLVGLLKPDSGKVNVCGLELTRADPQQINSVRLKIGYLFQGAALLNSLTVLENVELPLRERGGWSDEKLHTEALEKLTRVGLADSADKFPIELSGGMRKRAGLARAIAGRPSILIYDEPTSGLDPPGAADIGDLILKLQEDLGVTSLMVTHDLDQAFRVSNRIALLHEGRIYKLGTAEEFQNSDDPVVQSFVTSRRSEEQIRGDAGVRIGIGSQRESAGAGKTVTLGAPGMDSGSS
jgi:phospholipid/cholesterol/gamma-HCH transport system ATP-binding protein